MCDSGEATHKRPHVVTVRKMHWLYVFVDAIVFENSRFPIILGNIKGVMELPGDSEVNAITRAQAKRERLPAR